jgi:hypothetical protein
MDQQSTGTLSSAAQSSDLAVERRKVWILTGYAVSFLALCGVLAYYFSAYITSH